MRYFNCIVFGLLLTATCLAQTDNEFWFGAPDVSSVHGPWPANGAPIRLHITALYPTTVTIERPADDDFTPITFDMEEMEHKQIRLDDFAATGLTIGDIETYPSNDLDKPENKGFKVTCSPGEITCYYELDNYNNRDIFSLKGKNALGKDFWVGLQNRWPNGSYSNTAWSGFVICATKDNTVITIEQNDDWLYYAGPATRNIELDAGETFSFRAASRNANRHINGVHVTSSKEISITVYDDSVWPSDKGSCKDIVGDQLIPTKLIGQEYIVVKGFLSFDDEVFVHAVENETEVFVDNVSQGTINAGELINFTVSKKSTHVYATKPAYVTHLTGFGCELGGAVLPTIDGCTGSHDVTFVRTTSDDFYLNIMVRNDTNDLSPEKNKCIESFNIIVDGVEYPLAKEYFEFINDSSFAVLKDTAPAVAYYRSIITAGTEAQVTNPVGRFHLGIVNGGASTGCKYGYFSDYAESKATAGIGGAKAGTLKEACGLDPVRLVASGGKYYRWQTTYKKDSVYLKNLSDTTVADPYFFADSSGIYYYSVRVYGECFSDTTINMVVAVFDAPVSNFEVPTQTGCSPFTAEIINTTDQNLAEVGKWIIAGEQASQDTMDLRFNWTFPENHTDTVQTYKISLTSFANDFYSCPSKREKTIQVLPQINAKIGLADTAGCHPFKIEIYDSSTGHLDTNSYNWYFGDFTESSDELPTHTYNNFSKKDTVFTLQLITESPLGCTDTAEQQLVVHPRVRASLAIDTAQGCSPLRATLNPGNSIGVDTFFYSFNYLYGDSTYTTTSMNTFSIVHNDTSIGNGPDTLSVNMHGVSQYGCADTVTEKKLVVYPIAEPKILIDQNEICDSQAIVFTNNSEGYKLSYEWEFGDGTIKQDTTGKSYTKYYYNRSNADTTYQVTLHATSDYFCTYTHDTTLTVHPFVNADFGLSHENNCVPLHALIANSSIRAHQFEWDFGDGTPTSDTSASEFYHTFWNPLQNRDTTYQITLKVENNEGCRDSIQRRVDLFPQVVSGFNISDTIGCSPLTVDFENISTGSSLSYYWTFGNQTNSTSSNPNFSRIYTNNWENDTLFAISLTATNPQGCDSTTYDTVSVLAYIDASFSLPNSDSCSPFTVRPENLSSQSSKIFEWTFGSDTYTDKTPVIPEYVNATTEVDTIPVELVAYGFNNAMHKTCADTHRSTIYVYPDLSIDFELDTNQSCQPYMSPITNKTLLRDGTLFIWELDGGFYSSNPDPKDVFLYNNTDTNESHDISLYGISNYGCRDTARFDFTVFSHVKSQFSINKPGICSSDTIVLDRTTSFGGITNYSWDFGDGTSNTTDNIFEYTYQNETLEAYTRTISLTVENAEGCDSTWTDSVHVYPRLIADFDLDKASSCQPYQSAITNNTNIPTGNAYLWMLDGKFYSTAKNPNDLFIYNNTTNPETHKLELFSTSQYGCRDTIDKSFTVQSHVKAFFAVDKPGLCSFDTLTIDRSSTYGGITNYEWDFGDGNTSTRSDAIFNRSYSNTALTPFDREITLTVFNEAGCDSAWTETVSVYPQLVTDFELEQDESCQPYKSSITNNTNIPNGNNFQWLLDGNFYSSLENPKDLFIENNTTNNKTHELKLYGTSQYGCRDTVAKNFTVYSHVKSHFTLDRDGICHGYNIGIDRTSSFGGIDTYTWDFGNGNSDTRTTSNFEYLYENTTLDVIERTISLTVTNMEGCDSTWTETLQVYPKLETDFELDNYAGCQPLIANANNTSNITSGTNFKWLMDKTLFSNSTKPANAIIISNPYDTSYTRNITLIGNTEYGCKDTITKTATAYALVDARFTSDKAAICSDDSIFLDRSLSRGGIDNYTWYFDGNEEQTSVQKFYKTFTNNASSNPVSKMVSLKIENEQGCDSTWTMPITVYPKVSADFELDNYAVCYPHTTSFTNLSANASDFTWFLGDGNSKTDKNPEYIYENYNNISDKTFDIKLVSKSTYNCFDSIRKEIVVHAKPLVDFSFPVNTACPPFKASMVNASLGSNLNYQWDFAGEGTDSVKNTQFTFYNPTSPNIAVKPVTLTVTSDKGCSNHLTKNINVYPRVTVDYQASDWETCSPKTIQLTGDTTNANEMLWYVDGKAFSTLKNTSYRFKNESPNDRDFEVVFYGKSIYECFDFDTNYITLHPSPSAEFIPDPIIQDYNMETDQTSIAIDNATLFQNSWEYEWNYGDNNSDNQSAQQFNYVYGANIWGDVKNDNFITINLKAWNPDYPECSDEVSHNIIINPPIPQIQLADDIAGCVPFEVDFDATVKYTNNQYKWDFGDKSAIITTDAPTYVYNKPGTYTAKLTVEGDGGLNWDYRIVTVYPKPKVDFSFNDSLVFVTSRISEEDHEIINFYNHTVFGENYYWYFDAEELETGFYVSTEKDPTHFYEDTGTYRVALVAETEYGCFDTLTHPIPIRVMGTGFIDFPNGFFVDPSGPAESRISSMGDLNKRVFRPYASGVAEYKLEIYNRWGVRIFITNDINIGWNGYIDGRPAKQDVYIWRATGKFTNGQPFEKGGDVTLIVAPIGGETPF